MVGVFTIPKRALTITNKKETAMPYEWLEELNSPTVLLLATAILLYPIQLLLCFKVKSVLIRLIPDILIGFFTILFTVLTFANRGSWDALGYLVLALYTLFALLISGLAWVMFLAVKLILKFKKTRKT